MSLHPANFSLQWPFEVFAGDSFGEVDIRIALDAGKSRLVYTDLHGYCVTIHYATFHCPLSPAFGGLFQTPGFLITSLVSSLRVLVSTASNSLVMRKKTGMNTDDSRPFPKWSNHLALLESFLRRKMRVALRTVYSDRYKVHII